VTVGTVFHRSKVPLAKWLQIIALENTNRMQPPSSWQMAEASGLTYKTVEKMRARIQAALNIYDGPNTIFGRKPTAYIRSRRPQAPKVTRRPDGEGLDFRRWYAWRAKHPLGPVIGSKGLLAALQLDGIAAADLERTERLLTLLVSSAPVVPKKTKRKRKPKNGSAATNPA
jgi:hypothetical protein